MVRLNWLRCGSTPTQRSARRNFGKQGTVAAKQEIGPRERHCHSHRCPRHWRPRVLWVNPPSTSAIHWDVVQDFLSNMATYWLWVDACQFDVSKDKTWLFATSSQELLPLASQCNHGFQCKNTRHPWRSDPHTPNSFPHCAQHLPILSQVGTFGDFSRSQPSPSGQDLHLDTQDLIRGQRRYHCAQDLSSISLGAIQRYSSAVAQDPHKRALLPTLAGKTLVLPLPGT